MACEAMHTWSLSGLVGCFLDLVIAYYFLCAAAMAYIASKFLGLFGLCLPCPCSGLFGISDPNSNLCLQRLLIDYPTLKVSNVQLSVKNKFPFGGFNRERDKDSDYNVERLVEDRKCDIVEIEAEASCSSVTDGRKYRNFVGHGEELSERNGNGGVREGRFAVKGKGVMNHRPKRWLRRRRKVGVDSGKVSSVSSCETPIGTRSPSSSIKKGGYELVDERIADLDNGVDSRDSYYGHTSRTTGSSQRDRILLDEFHEEDEHSSSTELVTDKAPQELVSSVGDKHAIEILELALKEERAAHAALYLELEKERNAAATAADEAMAMILRLQAEKASFEMEARQYQRIIEEKTAYDAEEMNILKELLIRRETEKLFLEKEVESYRQVINYGNEQLPDDVGGNQYMPSQDGQPLDSLLDPSEDPMLMLHQLSVAIDKKALLDDKSTSPCSKDEEQNFQEKKIVSVGDNQYVPSQDGQRVDTLFQFCESSSSQEQNFPEKTIGVIGEEHRQDSTVVDNGMMRKDVETRERVDFDILINDLEHTKGGAFQQVENSSTVAFGRKIQVDDIRVIIDGSNSGNEDERSQCEQSLDIQRTDLPPEDSGKQSVDVIRDCPSTRSLSAERDIQRSASDVIGRLPPIDPRTRSLHSDLHRNSMTPIECERLRIDSEVESLLERLKTVHEGREKLNLSFEHQEKEKLQLKLLEDISHRLREIRQLTEPRKAIRQSSLPPPSTEVMSKKRRSRSVTSPFQKRS